MNDIVFAIFSFVLMISIIVTIHEFGHYLAARCFGLIGTHFSIGFGRKLFSWTDKHGTCWQIAPLLIGGYVKFPGDDKNSDLAPDQKTLKSLPRWQRAIVVAAGPGINFILAGFLFAAIAYFYGYPAGRPVITDVIEGSPAAEAGLRPGDEITRIDDAKILLANDISQRIMLLPGETIAVDYLRGRIPAREIITIGEREFDDGLGNKAKIGFLGVTLPQTFERSQTVGAAITKGVSDGVFTTYAQVTSLKQIITGERQVTELSGPIRIAKMSGHTLSLGLLPFLYLMAMLSIGVGIINLLPIPAFDGGHLATYAVEGIIGSDLPEAVAQQLMKIGVIMIAALGILAITLDIIAIS